MLFAIEPELPTIVQSPIGRKPHLRLREDKWPMTYAAVVLVAFASVLP